MSGYGHSVLLARTKPPAARDATRIMGFPTLSTAYRGYKERISVGTENATLECADDRHCIYELHG